MGCSCRVACSKFDAIFEHGSKGMTTNTMGYRIIDPGGTMLKSGHLRGDRNEGQLGSAANTENSLVELPVKY